jgi:hypothetical protein
MGTNRTSPGKRSAPSKEAPATVGVASSPVWGHFSLIPKDVEPENAMTIVVGLPDNGETSEMKLEFGTDVSL